MKLELIRVREKGVALAMLLWFLAGMTILVAGIVTLSKVDLKLVQLQLQELQAQAAGDGASMLLLNDILLLREQGEYMGRGIVEKNYILGKDEVSIRAVPITGLIDLNRASESLLVELFRHGAELEQLQAEELASNVLIWRGDREATQNLDSQLVLSNEPDEDEQRKGPFIVIEDLLQVEGINRDIVDRISRMVTTSQQSHTGVDELSSPSEVLFVISGGREGLVTELLAQRVESPYEDRGVALSEEQYKANPSVLNSYRLDALVTARDGKIYRRTRWVTFNGKGLNGLPWQFMRTEPIIAVNHERIGENG